MAAGLACGPVSWVVLADALASDGLAFRGRRAAVNVLTWSRRLRRRVQG